MESFSQNEMVLQFVALFSSLNLLRFCKPASIACSPCGKSSADSPAALFPSPSFPKPQTSLEGHRSPFKEPQPPLHDGRNPVLVSQEAILFSPPPPLPVTRNPRGFFITASLVSVYPASQTRISSFDLFVIELQWKGHDVIF